MAKAPSSAIAVFSTCATERDGSLKAGLCHVIACGSDTAVTIGKALHAASPVLAYAPEGTGRCAPLAEGDAGSHTGPSGNVARHPLARTEAVVIDEARHAAARGSGGLVTHRCAHRRAIVAALAAVAANAREARGPRRAGIVTVTRGAAPPADTGLLIDADIPIWAAVIPTVTAHDADPQHFIAVGARRAGVVHRIAAAHANLCVVAHLPLRAIAIIATTRDAAAPLTDLAGGAVGIFQATHAVSGSRIADSLDAGGSTGVTGDATPVVSTDFAGCTVRRSIGALDAESVGGGFGSTDRVGRRAVAGIATPGGALRREAEFPEVAVPVAGTSSCAVLCPTPIEGTVVSFGATVLHTVCTRIARGRGGLRWKRDLEARATA